MAPATRPVVNGAGITIQDAVDASNDATILWDTANDKWEISHTIDGVRQLLPARRTRFLR